MLKLKMPTTGSGTTQAATVPEQLYRYRAVRTTAFLFPLQKSLVFKLYM